MSRAALIAALVGGALGAFLAPAWFDSDESGISREGGHIYVIHRQVAPWGAVSDAVIVGNCREYVRAGMNHLDGYPDGAAFIEGCVAAAATTSLEGAR